MNASVLYMFKSHVSEASAIEKLTCGLFDPFYVAVGVENYDKSYGAKTNLNLS